jgi:hypothetical protein
MRNCYFNNVDNIECISIGSPGSRTFYLSADNIDAKVKIWLEKEQLIAIGLLLKNPENSILDRSDIDERDSEFNLDVKGINFSLNSDSQTYILYFECLDIQNVDDIQEIKLNILLNQGKAEDLADQILKVCASGRKKCPLCSLPKNQDGTCDGKSCVKKNGHIPLI